MNEQDIRPVLEKMLYVVEELHKRVNALEARNRKLDALDEKAASVMKEQE